MVLAGVGRTGSATIVEFDELETHIRLPVPNAEGGFVFHYLNLDTAIDIP